MNIKTLRKFSMRQVAFWLIAFSGVFFIACNENNKGQDMSEDQDELIASVDSLHQPKVNITVNRRYDDKGNLIGMDSTYSSYYSNVEGDTVMMDSLFHSFDSYFRSRRPSLFDRDLNPLFFGDSMRYHDFFHDDFFMKRYELNDSYFRDMMRRLDSTKNKFFREESERRNKTTEL